MRAPQIFAITLFIAACSEERPVTGLDGGSRRDASPSDSGGPVDGGPRRDGSVTGTIAGSNFDDLEIRWDEALELCSRWSGNDLAKIASEKVHFTIERSARASLSPDDLAAGQIDGFLRKSPFAAEQRAVAAANAVVFEYQIMDPTGDAYLVAAIEHDLGAGERLIERYSVGRSTGDRRPVIVDDQAEVTFTLERGDSSIELELCGIGEKDWVPALQVMSATRNGATMVVMREERQQSLVGGVYPRTMRSAVVATSADPYQNIRAFGPWAVTYGAAHHAWDENSVLDFSRDLAIHETYFDPGGGGPALREIVEKIEFTGVNSPGSNGTIRVHRRNFMTSMTTVEDWTPDGGWRPVHADAVQYLASDRCANPQVQGLEITAGCILQLIGCPGNGPLGYSLEFVVPVMVTYRGVTAGEPIEKSAFTPVRVEGRQGLRIPLGRANLDLAVFSAANGELIGNLFDEAGMMVYSGLIYQGPLRMPEPQEEILARSNIAGNVQMKLVRRWAAPGVGESSIFAPVTLEAELGGNNYRVEAWDRMNYTNTHHNWNDELRARTDTLEIHWKVEYTFDRGLVETLEAVEINSGAIVLPPTELQP